ncbi:MAG TPA: type III secretion system cytoplasmic ring protein SctQ [Burkholderiaceae bacterium]
MYDDSVTLSDIKKVLPVYSASAARLSRIFFDARAGSLAAQHGIRLSTVPAASHVGEFFKPACLHLRCAYGSIATIIDLQAHPALESAVMVTNREFRILLAAELLQRSLNKLETMGLPAFSVSFFAKLDDAGEAFDEALGGGLALRLHGEGRDEVIVIADADAAVVAAIEESLRRTRVELPEFIAKLQMPGRARIAQRLCAPSLLRSLRPGDVLLGWLPSHTPFDQGSLQNVGMHWGSPRGLQYVAKARIERATVTIESEPTLYIESESMNTQFVADENAPATDIAELELPVNLEIATMVLPVEQISSLQPGHVMELPIAIADAQIRLVSYGQTLGYGQLVTVGENFGFQISRMAKQHDADA